jgi:glucokinase
MILAGDVGGTKCNLGLFSQEGDVLRAVFHRRLVTRDYPSFEKLIADFLQQALSSAGADTSSIDAATLAVAGLIVAGRHHSENLPWVVDVAPLARRLSLKSVELLNDLAATALSLHHLSASDLVSLNVGVAVPGATRGVIAAGTGLGEAILFWDGSSYQVAAAEGGHADFAPRTERQIEFFRYLKRQLVHVSCEEIVSGRGFRRIHEFLEAAVRHESFDTVGGNAASEITQRALAQSCHVCEETLAFWIEMYGALCGNFTLQTMSLGGLYVAGGIAVKLLPVLQQGQFFEEFCGTGKLSPELSRVPVFVVTNEDAPMLGAAYHAGSRASRSESGVRT